MLVGSSAYPPFARTEIFGGVNAFYQRFRFRAPRIGLICGAMVRERRLRDGVEFFGFLHDRAKVSAEQRKVAA